LRKKGQAAGEPGGGVRGDYGASARMSSRAFARHVEKIFVFQRNAQNGNWIPHSGCPSIFWLAPSSPIARHRQIRAWKASKVQRQTGASGRPLT
jgi:hypothetical protein